MASGDPALSAAALAMRAANSRARQMRAHRCNPGAVEQRGPMFAEEDEPAKHPISRLLPHSHHKRGPILTSRQYVDPCF